MFEILLVAGFLLAVPIIFFVLAFIGIVVFALVGKKCSFGNSNDNFLRMHNNFMDTSRHAHEMHMNMHNNMFH